MLALQDVQPLARKIDLGALQIDAAVQPACALQRDGVAL